MAEGVGRMRDKRAPSKTICWDCRNAVPDDKYGCSWSMDFIPVEGWKAEQTTIMGYSYGKKKKYNTSYSVKKCPLFIRDAETVR